MSRITASPSRILMLALLLIIVVDSISSRSFPPGTRAEADSSRIVSLYADGQRHVFTTDAATVGQLLVQEHVTLNPSDLVEPDAATAIPDGYFNVNVYRARPVTVVDGDQAYHIFSAYQAPQLLAQAAGLTVYPQDAFTETTITNFVGAGGVGELVTVLPSVPFQVNVDGTTMDLRTRTTSVAAALAEAHIALGIDDTVSVPLTDPITSGLVITITRVNSVTTNVTETLPYTTQTQYDSSLLMGRQQVQQAGVNGQRTVTYHIVYHNGQEVSRTVLAVTSETPPTPEIVEVGTEVVTSSQAALLGQQLAAARGWTNDEWDSLYQLWTKESNWNSSDQAAGGACGIPQALPCGGVLQMDVAGQINWGLDYITRRYGDPNAAWAHEQADGWY